MTTWFITIVTLCICSVILSMLAKQDTKKTIATDEMCRHSFYTLLAGIEKMTSYESPYYKDQIADHWEYYAGRVDHKNLKSYRAEMEAAYQNRMIALKGEYYSTTVQ